MEDNCVDDINSGKHAAARKSLLAWNSQTFSIDKIID